jgi:hypothetical protein
MAEVARSRTVHAKFEKVLFYADGPQIVLLSVTGNAYIIAIAVDQVWQGDAFFGSRISKNLLELYLRNRCDLRYVLSQPDRHKHYTFNLPSSELSQIVVKSFDFDVDEFAHLLPDHRLFASDHSEEYQLDGTGFNFAQQYQIDGKWEVAEFSKFHRNLSDLYALSRSVERFEDETVPVAQRRKIMDSFIQPWQGGGSYVSFFKEVTQSGGQQNRPIVDAIQWASPGYMSILGDKGSFERIEKLLEHYDTNKTKIDAEYDEFWKYLSTNRLLKLGRRNFDKKSDLAALINQRAKSLSRILGLTSYRTLKKMSGNDPLIAGKVLLASGRRLRRMHQFFLEGRIYLEGNDIG